MTTRLCEALQVIGLATCGRLGARLASHLRMTTSWMTIVRRVMARPTPKAQHVECLGLDDFAFFAPAVVLGVALTVLSTTTPGFVFRCVAVATLLIWIAIRVIGTVPINRATLTWQLSAPSSNWKAQVNHANRFHSIGVWAAVLAFAFFLGATLCDVGAAMQIQNSQVQFFGFAMQHLRWYLQHHKLTCSTRWFDPICPAKRALRK